MSVSREVVIKLVEVRTSWLRHHGYQGNGMNGESKSSCPPGRKNFEIVNCFELSAIFDLVFVMVGEA